MSETETRLPEPPPEAARPAPRRWARRGRLAAQLVYYGSVATLAVSSTVQITRQVFFPPEPAEAPPYTTCRAGLVALYQAIEAGRSAAERGEDLGEEAALRRYREAVAPAWRYRDAVGSMCGKDPADRAALDAVERLRYSEEHSVRHQAVELSALRRHVKSLLHDE